MKKLLTVLLALSMLFGLAACGESAQPDPNAGLYEARTAQMSGISVSLDDVFEDGFSLELKNGGKAVFHYEGKDYSMKWTLDGRSFHAEGGGAELDGTLADGVMLLQDVQDSGLDITLICDELAKSLPASHRESTKLENKDPEPTKEPEPEVTAEPEPTEEPEPEPTAEPTPEPTPEPTAEPAAEPESDDLDWWNGKWYGWAVIYTATGSLADEEDTAWDVCAELTLEDEEAYLLIYDIESSPDDPTAEAVLTWEPGTTDRGCLVSQAGYFLFDEVEEGEWVIDPGDSVVSVFENSLLIYGEYGPDEDGDTFTYFLFLRPWGTDWSDVAEYDTDDMPYPDMMPMDYDDWYLPQLEKEAP